ncbi:Cof-type HAD-IIB family hydrolase [Spiroplasma taiwanense]|uniref:HAD superfamily hydrolase n=1 Tax=Spiroplasma taiwanense CT-1 TaxID=1276220 RepID=S5LT31_9MOLU|nr:Cof-type HAD-IIB family hydrolase [Spiroplasma taiwanense]AGR40844.1 HAD superfamily hydrolase [Spiroplasma taiwanense CT-1]
MNSIKLIVLDIDGTLVGKNKQVPKININAINEARNNGIKICIATGRNLSRAEKIAKSIELDKNQEYLICLNGGAIYKYDENKNPILIEEHLFNQEDFEFIYENAKKNNVNCFSYAQNPEFAFVLKKDLFTFVLKKVSGRKLMKFEKNINEKSYKIIAFGNEKKISLLKKALSIKKYEMFSWSYISHSSNIEINPEGVDKLYSLQKIANFYNIDKKEIIYFGDGDNDKKALEWVGYGVAMANADKHIKEISNDTTNLVNKKAGVGQYIKEKILKHF